MKCFPLLQREIISKSKNALKILKIFSRTSWSISVRLDTSHSRVNGIQIGLNKGLGSLQRGDNYRVNHFYVCLNGKNLLKNHCTRKVQIYRSFLS
jgi:hypothetical protein